jgi:phage shock protein C
MAKRLSRNPKDAVVAGVASGYGGYFDIDPVLVRLGFILLGFFHGIGLVFYLISWVIMPKADEAGAPATPYAPAGGAAEAGGATEARGGAAVGGGTEAGGGSGQPSGAFAEEMRQAGERIAGEMRDAGRKVADEARAAGRKVMDDVRRAAPDERRGGMVAGVVLIMLGLIFLVDRLPWLHWPRWMNISNLWPLILVAIGLAMILGARRKGRP